MYNEDYLVSEYDNDNDYRNNLLKLFNLEEFDIGLINKTISDLYIKYLDDKEIAVLMCRAIPVIFGTDNNEIGLMILHSYDYLYLFNRYLWYKKNKDNKKKDVYNTLLDKLNKK